MALTGPELNQIQHALLSAFPSQSSLGQMIRFGMNENLGVIASGSNLGDVVFSLITWAEAQGRLDELVAAARRFVPGNPDLKALPTALGMKIAQGVETATSDSRAASDRNPTSRSKGDSPTATRIDDNLAYDLNQQAWYGPLPVDEPRGVADAVRQTIDVILLTAVGRELDAVLRLLKPLTDEKHIWRVVRNGQTYYIGRFGEHNTAVTMCRMGDAGPGGAASTTSRALMEWNPKVVIMVGIAFGRDANKQKMADVLVSSQIAYYALQAVNSDGSIVHRGDITPCGRAVLDLFRNARSWKFARPDGSKCSVLDGQLLSGPILLNNAELKATLFGAFPYAIGGEMEAVGVYSAAAELKTDWIVVKAICDWGDGAKADNHQDLAAAAAASLVHWVLSNPFAFEEMHRPALAGSAVDASAAPVHMHGGFYQPGWNVRGSVNQVQSGSVASEDGDDKPVNRE